MIQRKPQIVDTNYSPEFYSRLWQQRSLLDFYLLSDASCPREMTDYKYNVESYPTYGILDFDSQQTFLFFHPLTEWIRYETPSYQYKGVVATNLPQGEALYLDRELAREDTSEFLVYSRMLLDARSLLNIESNNLKSLSLKEQNFFVRVEQINIDKGTSKAYRTFRSNFSGVVVERQQSTPVILEISLSNVGYGYIEFKYNDRNVQISDNQELISGNTTIGTVELNYNAVKT